MEIGSSVFAKYTASRFAAFGNAPQNSNIRGTGERMRNRVMTVVLVLVAAIVLTNGISEIRAQQSPYPTMAPLEQYLMPKDAEIALARSAAPASIANNATVMVLERQGYTTAVQGTNGFLCYVERSWAQVTDDP